jgi:hypothetical protein
VGKCHFCHCLWPLALSPDACRLVQTHGHEAVPPWTIPALRDRTWLGATRWRLDADSKDGEAQLRIRERGARVGPMRSEVAATGWALTQLGATADRAAGHGSGDRASTGATWRGTGRAARHDGDDDKASTGVARRGAARVLGDLARHHGGDRGSAGTPLWLDDKHYNVAKKKTTNIIIIKSKRTKTKAKKCSHLLSSHIWMRKSFK